MGKRKKAAKKPTGPKKNEPLPTTFACLFCNHEKSVTVKLDKKASTGRLDCKVCGQDFQTQVNYLSAAVDVYADWVDASNFVKQGQEVSGIGGDDFVASRRGSARDVARSRHTEHEDLDDDDELGSGYGGDGIVADDEY